jgi:hypothetical protein
MQERYQVRVVRQWNNGIFLKGTPMAKVVLNAVSNSTVVLVQVVSFFCEGFVHLKSSHDQF